MRVTKVIREYVENEVAKKFSPQLDKIGVEYYRERDDAIKVAQEFINRANDELISILKEKGMYDASYYDTKPVRFNAGVIRDREIESDIAKQRRDITAKRDRIVSELLLSLELGEANKSTLRDALDAIEIGE